MANSYTEPSNYIPKDIRKEFKVGEFAEPEKEDKKKGERTLQDAFDEYEKKSKK